MQAKLIVVGGDIGQAEIPLKLPTVIGRSRDATLTLAHPLVSRHHCEISELNGRLHVRDLGSRNGTFVANERISEAVLLPGELLTIGNVTFRVHYEVSVEGENEMAKTVRMRETVRSEGTIQENSKSLAESNKNLADNMRLSDEMLFRESDLHDENLGVDSGHFGECDIDNNKR
jgi:predicted component of type VI protein secretion system